MFLDHVLILSCATCALIFKPELHYSITVGTQMRLGAIVAEEDMFASQTYILKICSKVPKACRRCAKKQNMEDI